MTLEYAVTLEEVFADLLQEPVATMSDETSPKTVRNWDSLRHIELVMAIEAKYDVSFSTAEVVTITSLGNVRELLRQKGVAA